jgi:hypothetical protein
LDDAKKQDISRQLETIFSQLRLLLVPENRPLRDIQGRGCKDARRTVRVSPNPIMDSHQFEEFIFSGSKTATFLYTQFLRNLLPASPALCVFTHGDFRPENIMLSNQSGAWEALLSLIGNEVVFIPDTGSV